MIIDKKVEVKITKQNINYFENLGYSIKLKDIILIPVEHLQTQSHKKLNVKCDVCEKEIQLSYKLYLKNFNKYNLYTCFICSYIKNEKTLMIKYGVSHQMHLDSIRNKVKKTLLEKYGDENYNNREKNEKTCLEKFGASNAFGSDIILEKIKKTNNDKYDSDYYFGSKKFLDEIKDIFIKNYGVDNPSKSEEIQNKKLRKLYNNLNILNIDFKNKTYEIQCSICNGVYKIPFIILHQRIKIHKTISCLLCNPIGSFSNSGHEIQLQNFIKSNYNGEIILNSRNIIEKELDIYLPDLKLAFEFNGLYWHSELFKSNDYHLNKTESCEKHDIQLVHIYEDDWLFKQDIVKSNILNLLGKTNKILAENCEIREIKDNKLIRDFLNKNHIQGFVGSKIKVGLFYNEELVSLMIFRKLKKSMCQKSLDGIYEMLRYCDKLNTTIIGGASRLFKYYINRYNPVEIISYVDRSWSQGDLYEKLGFKLVHTTKPIYYYVINGVRQYKINYNKNKLIKDEYDLNKSEHEIMLERGMFKIYDSGLLKYSFSLII